MQVNHQDELPSGVDGPLARHEELPLTEPRPGLEGANVLLLRRARLDPVSLGR
jgi:hypothetical protein